MPVFVRLQFIRKVVVIKALMAIVPQFNCTPVYFDVSVYVGTAVMKRQHIILRADTSLSHITACF